MLIFEATAAIYRSILVGGVISPLDEERMGTLREEPLNPFFFEPFLNVFRNLKTLDHGNNGKCIIDF